MSTRIQRTLVSPEQTQAVGRVLGSFLHAGDFVALTGPLGAGKTQLIKGMAAGLGVPEDEPVVSPTFVLVREDVGRLFLSTIDAYRLTGEEELFSLGLAEMLTQDRAVVAVEWADRVPAAVPSDACRISLGHVGGDRRQLVLGWGDVDRLARRASSLGTVLDMPPEESTARVGA